MTGAAECRLYICVLRRFVFLSADVESNIPLTKYYASFSFFKKIDGLVVATSGGFHAADAVSGATDGGSHAADAASDTADGGSHAAGKSSDTADGNAGSIRLDSLGVGAQKTVRQICHISPRKSRNALHPASISR